MPYTRLYCVHLYWWKRQVSHQRWIWGIRCAQASKHASEGIHPGFEPRADITRSPKQGYQWPREKDMCPTKIKKKNKTTSICISVKKAENFAIHCVVSLPTTYVVRRKIMFLIVCVILFTGGTALGYVLSWSCQGVVEVHPVMVLGGRRGYPD